MFLTHLGLFRNIKLTNIINIPADNAFKYQITSADITVFFVINLMPYSFITLIDIWYNNSEFKGLLIDLSAATRSTDALGQL